MIAHRIKEGKKYMRKGFWQASNNITKKTGR